MARILYALAGDAGGHVARALCLAEELEGHDFLFAGGGSVARLASAGYATAHLPLLGTFHRDGRVDFPRTIGSAVKVLAGLPAALRTAEHIIGTFDPHLIVSDYEFFVPLAARRRGRPCISLDNAHILTECRFPRPSGEFLGRLSIWLSCRLLFSFAQLFLIVSFFPAVPRRRGRAEVFPPLVPRSLEQLSPSLDGHALVYQSKAGEQGLLEVLARIPRKFLVYGSGRSDSAGNLVFKQPSREGFLQDLASSSYVVCNGGHSLISEALYLGKPVLAQPLGFAYEQFVNGWYLRRLGYGDTMAAPDAARILAFEDRLDACREAISRASSRGSLFGNDRLRRRLEELIAAD